MLSQPEGWTWGEGASLHPTLSRPQGNLWHRRPHRSDRWELRMGAGPPTSSLKLGLCVQQGGMGGGPAGPCPHAPLRSSAQGASRDPKRSGSFPSGGREPQAALERADERSDATPEREPLLTVPRQQRTRRPARPAPPGRGATATASQRASSPGGPPDCLAPSFSLLKMTMNFKLTLLALRSQIEWLSGGSTGDGGARETRLPSTGDPPHCGACAGLVLRMLRAKPCPAPPLHRLVVEWAAAVGSLSPDRPRTPRTPEMRRIC